jgi:hypothetical protein
LYELKIHLIDPIKYDLDIREFLKWLIVNNIIFYPRYLWFLD